MTPEVDRITKFINARVNCARTVKTIKGQDGKPALHPNGKEVEEKKWHVQFISNADEMVIAEGFGDERLEAYEAAARAATEKFGVPAEAPAPEVLESQWKSSIESQLAQLRDGLSRILEHVGARPAAEPAQAPTPAPVVTEDESPKPIRRK